MKSFALANKKIRKYCYLTKDKLSNTGTQMEISSKKLLCWLAIQNGVSKPQLTGQQNF
jgi:hypothetical protein